MTAPPRRTVVLQVILSLEIGGMEQVVADLVRSLDPSRFTPVVACLKELGPLARELKTSGIPVIQVPPMPRWISFAWPAQLVRVIRETGAEVVHMHSGCWYKALVAARQAGVTRLVYTDHGRTFPDPSYVRALDWVCARLTDRVVAVSGELGHYLATQVGVPASKLSVIINGIDPQRYRSGWDASPPGRLDIVCVARLAPVKDHATLLRAMRQVLAQAPQARLRLVGDGPERAPLQALARELGIGDRVEFAGFRRDIPAVMAQCDIFALSSLSEGTSVTLLEAMAAGRPIVATGVGGTPALIRDGENGFLVPPGRPEALAQRLLQLAGDAPLRRRMGLVNRTRVEREFGLSAMVARYQQLYLTPRRGNTPTRTVR